MEPGLCQQGLAFDLAFGQPQAVSLLHPPTSSFHRNYRLFIFLSPVST